jgi:CubicO group peptidase (beta-lactamase class C family)
MCQWYAPTVAVLVFAAIRTVAVQTPSAGDTATAVQAQARELQRTLELPGLAVAVGVDSTIVVRYETGWADVERRLPVAPDSLFRIGSVSKLLTATAAARLQQAGTLDLDAPIGRYLKELPADKVAITAGQLAGHLAGMRHYGTNDYINTARYTDVTGSLGPILGQPLLAPPGTRYAYSSYGYNLLGAVLERVAGNDFRKVVQTQVLTPLGMSSTVAEDSASVPAARVKLYSKDERGALVEPTRSDLSDRWPSGGYCSSATDLARFGMLMLKPTFLRPDIRERMLTPQRTSGGTETIVGFGWRISKDGNGRRFIHHGGDSVGGRGFVLVYPDAAVSVALVTNVSFASFAEKEALKIAELFLPRQ